RSTTWRKRSNNWSKFGGVPSAAAMRRYGRSWGVFGPVPSDVGVFSGGDGEGDGFGLVVLAQDGLVAAGAALDVVNRRLVRGAFVDGHLGPRPDRNRDRALARCRGRLGGCG